MGETPSIRKVKYRKGNNVLLVKRNIEQIVTKSCPIGMIGPHRPNMYADEKGQNVVIFSRLVGATFSNMFNFTNIFHNLSA